MKRRFHDLLVLLIGSLVLSVCDPTKAETISNLTCSCSTSMRGEFGSDLGYLAKFYTPPQEPGESNHYIDLWAGRNIRTLAIAAGLTNNHALFVNSHGKSVLTGRGIRFAFYPHERLLGPDEKAPHFSSGDLARILGSANAGTIHNILIAGCDSDGAFRSDELRRHFVHATNITHVASGALGYQEMFLQAFVAHSANIKPVYETTSTDAAGHWVYHLGNCPLPHAKKLSPYVSDLFRPGEKEPFRRQVAGREILVPPH
jgi:hypothetical protein